MVIFEDCKNYKIKKSNFFNLINNIAYIYQTIVNAIAYARECS